MNEYLRDVYVVDAVRTPIGRYGGALSSVRPDDLAAGVLRGLLDRSPALDPGLIGDVLFGNSNGAGEENRDVARMAVLLAACPSRSPEPPSTGCAARGWRPSSRPPVRWLSAMSPSRWQAGWSP